MQGVKTRVTSGNIPVVRIHYSADSAKQPGTPGGDRWLEHALQGYPGGMASPRWRKEMEIDYGALGGTRLFPEWEQWSVLGRVVIDPFDPVGYKLYGSYDDGWRNPACYYVHGVNPDGEIVTLWEFYASQVPIKDISKIIKGETTVTPDGRMFEGNPYAGLEVIRIADPSMWAEDKPMQDGTNKSNAHLFELEGIFFDPGERGGDLTVASWLLGDFWRDPGKPRYRITRNCQKLIWEIGKLRHKEISARVGLHRDQPEQLEDKDNHAWDALKMFLKRFPPKPQAEREKEKPGSFAWWREQAIRAKKGEMPMSYRREM